MSNTDHPDTIQCPAGKHWILAFTLRKWLNNPTKNLKMSTRTSPIGGPTSLPQDPPEDLCPVLNRSESDLQSGLCTLHIQAGPEGSPTEHRMVRLMWLICVRLCQITTVGFKRKVHPKDENSLFKTRPHPLQFFRRMPTVKRRSR